MLEPTCNATLVLEKSSIDFGEVTIRQMRLNDNELPWEEYELRDPLYRLKNIVRKMQFLSTSFYDYPMSEKHETVEYGDDETGYEYFYAKSDNPKARISTVINELVTIQEICKLQKELGSMRNLFMEETLDNLIYSLGADYSPRNLGEDFIPDIDDKYDMEQTSFMADGYHDIILPFVEESREQLPR